MLEADVIAAITKLPDRMDARTLETRRIVEGLAQRREDAEKALKDRKDMVLKSSVEARVDAIAGRRCTTSLRGPTTSENPPRRRQIGGCSGPL